MALSLTDCVAEVFVMSALSAVIGRVTSLRYRKAMAKSGIVK
jgi:hypothetical protein